MPTALDAFAGLLAELREAGAIPSSRVRGKALTQLKPLLDAGIVVSSRSGSGKVISVADATTLDKFILTKYPSGLFATEDDGEDIDRRTLALTRYRDSKALGGLDFEIVEFRLTGQCPLQIGTDRVTPAGLSPGGLGALVLHDQRRSDYPVPAFSGRIATVENPTVFLSYPWATQGIDLVVLTYGRMSRRLVDWLAGAHLQNATVDHFGDYDPVGLCEFLRIHQRLGDRSSLFVPDNLDELFQQFARRDLLTRSASLLPRLQTCGVPSVLQILSMMRKHSGGLEHEALAKTKTGLADLK